MMTGKYKRSSLMKTVKEVVVPDESTVQFNLKEPFRCLYQYHRPSRLPDHQPQGHRHLWR